MPAANNLPITRTLSEILFDLRNKKFTGVAILNVFKGIPQSIEYGRPDRIQLDHSELLSTFPLTKEENTP